MMGRVAAIVVAAGEGKRFGSPKHRALLAGKTVLERTLGKFNDHPQVHEIVLVLKNTAREKDYREQYPKINAVTQGGVERQDSVQAGFREVSPVGTDVVLVHDAARPLASKGLITRIIQTAGEKGAAVPVVPLEDTIKRVQGNMVLGTVNRHQLGRVQTPQGFRYPILKAALEKASQDNYYGTDEASLVERLGKGVVAVPGEARNIKITTPEDLGIAEAFLED
jgi:2-C-methyl-D-erythritol 4-phosphate cytidylyltransferase